MARVTSLRTSPGADFVAAPVERNLPAAQRVGLAFDRITASGRPEVWITLADREAVTAAARQVDARIAAGELLPLAGLLVAVKDNIDVADFPTTAACPEFGYRSTTTATAVARLIAAGALILGKTNMDQFATGLVGTRSPYGAVRCAWNPDLISGGSSAGSAVAVALGLVDVGIGTDTAGSGRVPAALQGLIGLKPTLGLVPTTGVVPACADYDSVSVFAAELAVATAALAVMAGRDDADPRSRSWPSDTPLAAPATPRIAVPRRSDLVALQPAYRKAFEVAVADVRDAGMTVEEVDISGMTAAARLLYDGALVAGRYAAVGSFLETRPEGADPVVSAIILSAGAVTGPAVLADQETLLRARTAAARALAGFDGLLLPTTTEHPTIAAVQAEPLATNRRMGTFTNFCNVLDMAAVAFPAAPAAGAPFGVMMVVPAFHDQIAVDLVGRILGVRTGQVPPDNGIELAVFGAHLRGQPLNGQLQELGARFLASVHTADSYRLVAMDTLPPKPGLVRVGQHAGAPIAGEKWLIAPAALGRLTAELPAPMSLTSVELSDGSWVVGFGCSYQAALEGNDITSYGGWERYLQG